MVIVGRAGMLFVVGMALIGASHAARADEACLTTVICLSGEVGLSFDSSTDAQKVTSYTFLNVSAGITANAPTISVSAVPGTGYWTNPLSWNGRIYEIASSVTIADTVIGIIEHPFLSILNIPQTVDTLLTLGPTEQNAPIPGLSYSVPILGHYCPVNHRTNSIGYRT